MRTESLELTGETDEAVLTELGAYAYDQGWADESYADALLAREADYPTGLDIPTMGFGIAIPHADPDHVTEQAVLLGLPPAGESIAFRSMDNPDEHVAAEVVVLLLVTDTDGYSSFLSNLAKLFQAEEFAEMTKRRDADGLLDLVVERCVDFDG
ncbi:PTS galactitol enzyme II A subunit [Haloferax sp. Atlit-12N]|uniref:PTS sugar transporter subunit IIA n=1 Tax=Haloferax sp. Atlit-12N TaxID=2077203 RepID=UPI000E237FAE|nr:PTS sugar transporter subunit IIA [Haloferax sp. Atlit-12N]RDZ63897.1 PTS galactitol enzyme II A subunit [Haloferax sp. Atlit-12N]